MKKIIALIASVALVLSLSACFMPNANNNSDSSSEQANAADVTSYDKDFDGLVKYITDRGSNYEKMDIYYDLLGVLHNSLRARRARLIILQRPAPVKPFRSKKGQLRSVLPPRGQKNVV